MKQNLKYSYNENIQELIRLSLSMYRKNLIGIFHGSISVRVGKEKFIINNKNSIFDELTPDDFSLLYFKEDYRYKNASIDSQIHKQIYKEISDAKYISYTMPHHIIAYSFSKNIFKPLDYFGNLKFPELKIFDPKNFTDWYERAPYEITNYLKKNNNIMIIKGYGIYAYNRDIMEMIKEIAIIENSAKLFLLNSNIS